MVHWYDDFKDEEWNPPEPPKPTSKSPPNFAPNSMPPDGFDNMELHGKSKKSTFLFFQIICSLLLAVIFILLQTFQPNSYDSIRRHMKTSMAVTIDFQKESEKVTDALKGLTTKIKLPQTSSQAG